MTRIVFKLASIVAGVAAGGNLLELVTQTPADQFTAGELVTWLVRGALSLLLFLTAWLFKQAVEVLRDLRLDADDLNERVVVIETKLDIDPRREDRGVRARRRRSFLIPPREE